MNVYVGPDNICDKISTCDGRHCTFDPHLLLKGMGRFKPKLHRSLVLHGFDILGGNRGWISAVHSAKDIEEGIAAFEAAVVDLKESGDL